MTVKYARAAGNWNTDATWSTTSGGAADTTKPTNADDVIINSASGNVAVDTGGVCRSLDCDTYTGTLTINASCSINIGTTTAPPSGRALRLSSGMTWTGAANNFGIGFVQSAGAGTVTVTSAGKTMTNTGVTINGGGTVHLADAMNIGTGGINHGAGTFVDNGFAVTCFQVTVSASVTATGTWTLTATTAINIWNCSGGTLTMTGSTIVIGNASSSTRTFIGGGKTYGTLTYTVAGSTGQMTITGQNTFATINFSDVTNARTLAMPTSSGTTVTGTFNVNGTSGKLMTVTGDLTKASGTVSCDYLSISNSDAAGGATFYAGANSTNGGSNTGWVFTAPPNTGSVGDGVGKSLNRLAGTTNLDAQGAANVWAGTVGLDLVGALNRKASTWGVEYNGVCKLLASQLGGDSTQDAQGALASIP